MGQVVAVFLNVMVLLLVPLGILQIHTVVQTHNELLEVSAAAAKYVSNHGGGSDAEVMADVRSFVSRELAEKSFSLPDGELSVRITRTRAADPVLWSHEDEFLLQVEVPYPRLTELLPGGSGTMRVERYGTINIMDYDL
jgi:hypothetical protein